MCVQERLSSGANWFPMDRTKVSCSLLLYPFSQALHWTVTSTDGLTWGWLGVFGVELILRWGIYYVLGLKGGHCWVWFLQPCQYFDLTVPFVTCCLILCWRSKASHRHSRLHHWYSTLCLHNIKENCEFLVKRVHISAAKSMYTHIINVYIFIIKYLRLLNI